MAVPALADRSPQPRALPLREVRTRLTQLVSLAELTDTVTLVTRDGDSRPIAAISAGWARRLEELHQQSGRRHAAELRALADALAEAWAELDRRAPAGDPALIRLRAAHADLLRR
ncbi:MULTISPECIES: hypothetical protein [unclassified Micromonospora]|uniref:hypothetical protein n=1 Tax=unclassified Micromonospora TaxID=2617518 RepID=UPI0005BA6143|nr:MULTISPECIES: hypothetical protein [unclassified Micromonospora]MCK1810153.1 type II toxin-antitoxin system Phd/YefM family antitoxin [Micromonospora sp. R42106]MCK1835349.1 type II toxin-antitoxin system Phd/YefM family antitoxin [Micromonospora sp. R42003]MCK1847266.1 type II toxin-antitoxin system Phd/YefM family antitoxin [Micromonospora sp. R42004]MCM1018822.1 type II toxin-antitoxin system Phd/YefM family antitoxin [Micromonospora sp. XM-20-01]